MTKLLTRISNPIPMKYSSLFITLLFCTALAAQQPAIKRASLSTGPQTSHKGDYMVQHSIGFMGAMSTQEHSKQLVTRGFLLPQANPVEFVEKLEWSLYPVPFSTYLNIDFSAPVTGDMHVLLFDVTGQLVFDETYTAQQKQKIYIGHLAQGEYLIQVGVMNQTFSTQILNYASEHRNQ